jgi:hypothetical protein
MQHVNVDEGSNMSVLRFANRVPLQFQHSAGHLGHDPPAGPTREDARHANRRCTGAACHRDAAVIPLACQGDFAEMSNRHRTGMPSASQQYLMPGIYTCEANGMPVASADGETCQRVSPCFAMAKPVGETFEPLEKPLPDGQMNI